jgi:hypothetical protein
LDRRPVILTGERIQILPPQKTNVVCILQLIDVCRIPAELLIEAPDCKRILVSPANEFFLFLPLDCGSHAWSSRGKPNDQQSQSKENREQDVAALVTIPA